MAHLVKCLSCKHEDMKWIPRLLLKTHTTHACMLMARNQVREHELVTPLLERKRLEEAVWMNRGTPGH